MAMGGAYTLLPDERGGLPGLPKASITDEKEGTHKKTGPGFPGPAS